MFLNVNSVGNNKFALFVNFIQRGIATSEELALQERDKLIEQYTDRNIIPNVS